MIDEGEQAPSFDLPAVIEGRPGRVSLDALLGESVVVLVFYPADFNPSCTDQSTDLSEFDVFRMQSDAVILAVSGDSVYSHREFARTHDLHLPLLADVGNEVAEAYGVESDDPRYPNDRAVVVIDHDGVVTYTWLADNIEQRPDIEEVQAAFEAVGDADLAVTRYREGCDRYDEARDAFVEGMGAYRRREWVLACSEFETADEKLEAAYEDFRRALRFSETEAMAVSFERGQDVVEELARAVGLLSDAASAHASRDGERGQRLRTEAEDVLERVKELGALPDPEDLPADIDDDGPTGEGLTELEAVLEGDAGDQTETDTADPVTDGTELLADSGSTDAESTDAGSTAGTAKPDADRAETVEDDEDIDEAELEALTAEIETQDASDAEDGDDR
jgi:peroxiredoxin